MNILSSYLGLDGFNCLIKKIDFTENWVYEKYFQFYLVLCDYLKKLWEFSMLTINTDLINVCYTKPSSKLKIKVFFPTVNRVHIHEKKKTYLLKNHCKINTFIVARRI